MSKKMISYKPLIIFKNKNKETKWVSSKSYATKKDADTELNKVVLDLKKARYPVIETGYEEVELEKERAFKGVVGDNGCLYEDYAVTLTNNKDYILIESEIEKNFRGRNIKITIEVID